MNLKLSMLVSVIAIFCFATIGINAQDVQKIHQPPMLGVHWAKGAKPAKTGGGSPDMTLHGGDIMTDATVQAIFWGTSWGTNAGDKIGEMDLYYQGFGGSNYAGTSDEYTGVSGDKVSSTVTYSGHFVDDPGRGREQHFDDPGGSLQGDSESSDQRLLPGLYRPSAQGELLRIPQLGLMRGRERAVRLFLEAGW